MTNIAALLTRLREHGLLLQQDKRLPDVATAVAGEPIRGSWWAHPRAHAIFACLSELEQHPDTLATKLIAGKVTFIHRRLWPALVRVADRFPAERLLVFKPGDEIVISSERGAHFMLFGGASLGSKRYIWWNFVSSSKERIEQAKEEWKTGRFDIVPGDEEEFIPLPDN